MTILRGSVDVTDDIMRRYCDSNPVALTSTVERVAKAIADSENDSEMWEAYTGSARAAIAVTQDEKRELVTALRALAEAFVNPGDGGKYENGEVPVLDAARALIAKHKPKGGAS